MNPQSTRTLHTGRTMPIIGLGTWKLTDETDDSIAAACDLGYRMIDTSGDYGTQHGVGKGLKDAGIDRDSVYLVTKVEEDENAYESIRENLEEMELDYADLVLIHRPPEKGVGEALWDGLIKARADGLTKDIGVSNYAISQIETLAESSGEIPVVNQIEWTPFGHSQEMLQFCNKNGIVIQAYSPLTRGERFDDDTLTEIAKAHQKTPAQILLRWCLQLGVVPLPKANSSKHQAENIDIFDFEISQSDMDRLNDLNEHFSALGSLLYV